jgi:cytochrome c-type protein NapC
METHEGDQFARMPQLPQLHSFTAMDTRRQKSSAQKHHAEAQKDGKTCIDCHKGIAHMLPKEYVDPNEEE